MRAYIGGSPRYGYRAEQSSCQFTCRSVLLALVMVALTLSPSSVVYGATNQTEASTPSVKDQLVATMKPTGAVLSAGTLLFPTGFMKSVKDYGATGNGTTDDTAAIQAALSDGRSKASGNYYGLPKALYFPPGTYLVSKTLSWNGCCVTLQGAGPSASVIRLAPNSPGYED